MAGVLMDLPLGEVADNPGIRIRWAELYSLLREPVAGHIIFNAELTACGAGPVITWRDRVSGESRELSDIDLLIAGDGRYSLIRNHVLGGPEVPHFHGGLPLPPALPRRRGLPHRRLRPVVQRPQPAARLPGAGRTSSTARARFPSRPIAASPRP